MIYIHCLCVIAGFKRKCLRVTACVRVLYKMVRLPPEWWGHFMVSLRKVAYICFQYLRIIYFSQPLPKADVRSKVWLLVVFVGPVIA